MAIVNGNRLRASLNRHRSRAGRSDRATDNYCQNLTHNSDRAAEAAACGSGRRTKCERPGRRTASPRCNCKPTRVWHGGDEARILRLGGQFAQKYLK